MNLPFNEFHELYRVAFERTEEKLRAAEEEEKKRKAEEEAARKGKKTPKVYEKQLSPAEQARAIRAKQDEERKAQFDEQNSEGKDRLTPPTNFDTEELVELLEEGI